MRTGLYNNNCRGFSEKRKPYPVGLLGHTTNTQKITGVSAIQILLSDQATASGEA
jgi:hypothetical protein